jgi:ribonuclease P protein component
MLPPQSRLRRSADIGRVRQEGQRLAHTLVVLFVDKQSPGTSPSRFAFAVGRHIGKAAQRNRVKRRLREIVRRHMAQVGPGYDCLFVARAGAATANHTELEGAVLQLLARGGVMTANSESRGT